jgi:hypothetical protein
MIFFGGIILIAGLLIVFSSQQSIKEIDEKITVDEIFETHFTNHDVRMDDVFFSYYLTEEDFHRVEQNLPGTKYGIGIGLIDSKTEIYEKLKPSDNTVVIYPLFTSAAYTEPGFYTFYRGECDESCLTVNFENQEFTMASSITGAQVLHALGYEFITDIDVDKNPEILLNYDTIVLLHNEYVTQKEFNAISNHSNVIFLYPNALYAKIEVDYSDKTITLIQGHSYPNYPNGPKNGFNYEIEKQFHVYEQDRECLDWHFTKIENGYHLNCYPDYVITKDLRILFTMKDLL